MSSSTRSMSKKTAKVIKQATPQNTPEDSHVEKYIKRQEPVDDTPVPQEAKELLAKWIISSATQEKLDIGFSKTDNKFANVYSWASGSNVLSKDATEQEKRQFTAVRRSYILHDNKKYHKTRIFLCDDYVVKKVEEHFGGKYSCSIRKYENSNKDSLVYYRWVVQFTPK